MSIEYFNYNGDDGGGGKGEKLAKQGKVGTGRFCLLQSQSVQEKEW